MRGLIKEREFFKKAMQLSHEGKYLESARLLEEVGSFYGAMERYEWAGAYEDAARLAKKVDCPEAARNYIEKAIERCTTEKKYERVATLAKRLKQYEAA